MDPTKRGLRPTRQARWMASRLFSPWFSADTGPQGRAARLNSAPPASPPLPSGLPTVRTQQMLEASRSASLGPFRSYWEAARWASARMDWHPGDPSGHPRRTLTHSTTHSGAAALRASAAAGGGTGTSGCGDRRRYAGTRGWRLSLPQRLQPGLPGKWSCFFRRAHPPSGSSLLF